MNVPPASRKSIFSLYTTTLEENILHPMVFASSLYHDIGEVTEDLIDWKRGVLPKDSKLPQKLFSVIGRLGAIAILGVTVYQIAFATGTPLLVRQICNRIFFSGILLTLGSFMRNNEEAGYKILVAERTGVNDGHDTGEQQQAAWHYDFLDTKFRLGWREYLMVHACAGSLTQSLTQNNGNSEFDFTTYTYVHTEIDPAKRKPMSNNTKIVWRKGEEQIKETWLENRFFPNVKEGQLPEHLKLPEVKISQNPTVFSPLNA